MAASDAGTAFEEPFPIEGVHVEWRSDLPPLQTPPLEMFSPYVRQEGDSIEVEMPHARYRMTGGTRIDIVPNPDSDRETELFFLKATPLGVLIFQRGELPIHAASVVPPWGGPALLVCGDSGAGKSTTTGALVQRGWKVLNDDLTRITFDEVGAIGWPGYRTMKVSEDSIRLLGLDPSSFQRTHGIKEKYNWLVDGVDEPTRIGAMLILGDPSFEFSPPTQFTGMERFSLVFCQTFRHQLVVPLGFQKRHFALLGQFLSSVPVFGMHGHHVHAPSALAGILESFYTDRFPRSESGSATVDR